MPSDGLPLLHVVFKDVDSIVIASKYKFSVTDTSGSCQHVRALAVRNPVCDLRRPPQLWSQVRFYYILLLTTP